jgi:exo-beta-1,3-glucanase (GH17 family)
MKFSTALLTLSTLALFGVNAAPSEFNNIVVRAPEPVPAPLAPLDTEHAKRMPSSQHKRTARSLGRKRTAAAASNATAEAIASLKALSKACPKASNGTGPAVAAANSPPKTNTTTTQSGTSSGGSGGCFPAQGFQMPSGVPSSTDNWWCPAADEYAFVGFSYEVTACQSLSQLKKEFKDIRETFKGRYVRLYGTCDNKGFYDDIVEAAWENTLGVHALIWFGFTGGNAWETRRDTLFATLKSNPKAKFVTKVVQFGSEPLFDSVLSPSALAAQVTAAKKTLAPLGIPVTVSELAYGYQEHGGAQDVLNAIDSVNAHILPFFSTKATSGSDAWPLVTADLTWYQTHAKGKKIWMDENGWPSEQYPGVQANSKKAVANVNSEAEYFNLLDSKCSWFKQENIAWFMHIYSDDQEPGYGLYSTGGSKKFKFAPKISC